MLYEVRCLKSNEDMILALAGQLSDRAVTQKFFRFMRQLLKDPVLTIRHCARFFCFGFHEATNVS